MAVLPQEHATPAIPGVGQMIRYVVLPVAACLAAAAAARAIVGPAASPAVMLPPLLVIAGGVALRRGARATAAAFAERQAEVEARWRAAERASENKSRFLSTMSHEVRTPLTMILGYNELLAEAETPPEERQRCVEIIRRQGVYLTRLLNDVLDLAKVEAGKLDIVYERCALPALVAEVEGLMRVEAAAKGLRLLVAYRTVVPEQIVTDATRLRQILINLVGNAIKFTAVGEVTITVGLDAARAGRRALLRVDVSDTGVGISEEAVGAIFEPFAQESLTTAHEFGGTGLGLAISRQLARRMGGDVTVKTTPGAGSTFSLTLDPQPPDARLEPVAAPPAAVRLEPLAGGKSNGGPRILVAEDAPEGRALIALMLRHAGCAVTPAANGIAACDLALAASARGEPFDVILMDMHMPELDGYGAVRRLRGAGYAGAIVALTASAMAGDREQCLAAGCDDYLSKPIDNRELMDIVGRLSRSRRQADTGPHRAAGGH